MGNTAICGSMGTDEKEFVCNSSLLLSLIGQEDPEQAKKYTRMRRVEATQTLQLSATNVVLVYHGTIQLYLKGVKMQTIKVRYSTTTISKYAAKYSTSRQAYFKSSSLRNGCGSHHDSPDEPVLIEEVIIYCKSPHEYVCRYSTKHDSSNDELVLKSQIADKVVAMELVRYLTVPTRQLSRSNGMSQPLKALINDDVLELVGAIPFFHGISRDKLLLLTELSTIRVYPPEAIIFKEDEQENTQMFITLAGKIQVLSSKSSGILATLEAGTFFGEMSLMINTPRAATVRVEESCLVMTIEKSAFHAFLNKCPEVSVQIYNLLKERLISKVLASGVIPFLNALPKDKVLAFAHDLQIDSFMKGDTVMSQEKNTERFGLLVNGYLEIRGPSENDVAPKQDVATANSPGAGAGAGAGVGAGAGAAAGAASPVAGTLSALALGATVGKPKYAHTVIMAPGCYFGMFTLDRLNLKRGRIQASGPVVVMTCDVTRVMDLLKPYPIVAAEAVIAWQGENCDLASVLQHPTMVGHFQTFLEAEHSEENFYFCLQVERFRSMESPEAKYKVADAICQEFIVEFAPQQVNLPSKMRQKLLTRLEELKPPNHVEIDDSLFQDPFDEIMTLMTRDCFPRFKRTTQFQQLINAMDSHLYRKGSILLEACQRFREHMGILKSEKVEPVRIKSLHQLLSRIKQTHDHHRISMTGSPFDPRIGADG